MRIFIFVCLLGCGGPKVSWPPQLGQPYPDLELVDQTGQKTRLSSFKGKVILIEPVGMP
jgi:cytochrome oxidase Cu insertion factor (SCO1/SenC/PrrC family)